MGMLTLIEGKYKARLVLNSAGCEWSPATTTNVVMSLRFRTVGEFLDQMSDCQVFERHPALLP